MVRKIKETFHRGLRYSKLEKSFLRLVAISNALIGNNRDLTLQLGHINVLTYNSGRVNILSYTIYKPNRVVISVLRADTYSLADCFDSFYVLCNELSSILQYDISLLMSTDSAHLFNIIIRSLETSDRRLMVDLTASRETKKKR